MPCAGGGDGAVVFVNWEVIFDSVLQFDLSFLFDGRGLALRNCSHSVAVWVMASCSQSGTLRKQEAEAAEGSLTWTHHLLQSTHYIFSLLLIQRSQKVFPPTQTL